MTSSSSKCRSDKRKLLGSKTIQFMTQTAFDVVLDPTVEFDGNVVVDSTLDLGDFDLVAVGRVKVQVIPRRGLPRVVGGVPRIYPRRRTSIMLLGSPEMLRMARRRFDDGAWAMPSRYAYRIA